MRFIAIVSSFALLSACSLWPFAQSKDEPPMPPSSELAIPVLELPGPQSDPAARDGDKSTPYRFADVVAVDVTPQSHGVWSSWDEHQHRWRLEIRSAGALSLNLHFSEFELPAGAKLTIFNPAQPAARAEFGMANNRSHGQLWTPQFLGDHVQLDLVTDPQLKSAIKLRLKTVNVGFR